MIKILLARLVERYETIAEILDHPKIIAYSAGVVFFVNQYIFSQWSFAFGFFGIFIMDTISGIYISFKREEFNTKTLRDKMADKCLVYFTIIISYSMATKIVLEGEASIYIDILNVPFYATLVGAEMMSILRNWYQYKKWSWLKILMKHFNAFEEEKTA